MMKIHAIQTGTVAVTRAWREGVGHGKRRLLNTVRDWVLVDEGDPSVFLAGDSSYTVGDDDRPAAVQKLMLRGKVDGVGADELAERLTHERIGAFATGTPTVYLVAHDPETGARLAERQLVLPTVAEMAS